MRIFFSFYLVLFALLSQAQDAQDIEILIDGKPYNVQSNKQFTYITLNGDSVKFEIKSVPVQVVREQPASRPVVETSVDFKNYKDDFVAFTHLANFSIAKTSESPGIQQLTFVSGNGSGVIIQEFSTFNPSSLVGFLLQDLLEDYGSESQISRAPVSMQSANNRLLVGEKATITTGGNIEEISVYAYGKSDKGLLISVISTGDDEDVAALLNGLSVF